MADFVFGQGPTLPLAFTDAGDIELADGSSLILGALNALFGTEVGEHPMDKDFGHSLTNLLFLNFSESIRTLAQQLISEYLSAFEDRIQVTVVVVDQDKEQKEVLNITVFYTETLTGANSRFNASITF